MRDKIKDLIKEVDSGCAPYYDVIPNLIRERGYLDGIEIGVFVGGHAESILTKTNLKLLVGIDPYLVFEQNPKGMETQLDYDDIFYYAMSRLDHDRYWHIRLTSDEAFPIISKLGDVFDFVFIDGLHTYDQVKRDLANYSQLIRKGGVIACHDYNHPDFPLLTNAIDEFAAENNAEIIICPFHAIYMNKTW